MSTLEEQQRIARQVYGADATAAPVNEPPRQKTVYFFLKGQFGNNLFQYFAAEIMRKIYGYDRVSPTFHINLEQFHVIDDEKYKKIIHSYMEGHPYPLDPAKDILLEGFFQRSEIFEFERTYLRSLFIAENDNRISNRIRIGNIVTYKTKHTIAPGRNDLTMHVRFGTTDRVLFDPNDLKRIIQSIPHDKLFIVRQPPTTDVEREYESMFADLSPPPIWIHGNLGDDFDFMLRSNKLITSSSTMSYLAAFLGSATEVHLPYNHTYGGEKGNGQHLGSFDDQRCHVYEDIQVWSPCSRSASTSI